MTEKNPKPARPKTEKKVASRSIDAQIAAIQRGLAEMKELFPGIPSAYEYGPVWTEEELAAFETKWGVALPPEYRRFLATVGDGGAEFLWTGKRPSRDPRDETVNDGVTALRSVDDEVLARISRPFPFTRKSAKHQLDGTVPINIGDPLSMGGTCLVLNGAKPDVIWTDNRGVDTGAFEPVASFLQVHLDRLATVIGKERARRAPPGLGGIEKLSALEKLQFFHVPKNAERMGASPLTAEYLIGLYDELPATERRASLLGDVVKAILSHQLSSAAPSEPAALIVAGSLLENIRPSTLESALLSLRGRGAYTLSLDEVGRLAALVAEAPALVDATLALMPTIMSLLERGRTAAGVRLLRALRDKWSGDVDIIFRRWMGSWFPHGDGAERKGANLLDGFAALEPPFAIDYRRALGAIPPLIDGGQLARAERLLAMLGRADPSLPLDYSYAWLRMAEESWVAAAASFVKALADERRVPGRELPAERCGDVWAEYAYVLWKLEDIEGATTAAKKALSGAWKEVGLGNLVLANIAALTGDKKKFLSHLQKCVQAPHPVTEADLCPRFVKDAQTRALLAKAPPKVTKSAQSVAPGPRHPAVPASARWTAYEWGVETLDEDGLVDGLARYFRQSDGTLILEQHWVHGVEDGPYERFHPNGERSQKGQMRDDLREGECLWQRSTAPTDEGFVTGVAPNVWRMETHFDEGYRSPTRLFDEDGQALAVDGTPAPERPASVPTRAAYAPTVHWFFGRSEDGSDKPVGLWRWWDTNGDVSRQQLPDLTYMARELRPTALDVRPTYLALTAGAEARWDSVRILATDALRETGFLGHRVLRLLATCALRETPTQEDYPMAYEAPAYGLGPVVRRLAFQQSLEVQRAFFDALPGGVALEWLLWPFRPTGEEYREDRERSVERMRDLWGDDWLSTTRRLFAKFGAHLMSDRLEVRFVPPKGDLWNATGELVWDVIRAMDPTTLDAATRQTAATLCREVLALAELSGCAWPARLREIRERVALLER